MLPPIKLPPTKDDECRLIIKKFDDLITGLVVAVVGENVPREPYSDEVHEAVRKVAKAYRKWELLRGLV
jgi:hypothetical protein